MVLIIFIFIFKFIFHILFLIFVISSKYFCLRRFIELIKDKYPKVSQILRCFDPRKSVEKTKYNQIQYYPYWVIIYIDDKKSALDYIKRIDICNIDDISDIQYEIVITMSECKSRVININKAFQILAVLPEMRQFITKDNKSIE
jgi:hypothetical protein